MPLTQLNDDDYRTSAWRGIKFWMADEEGHPVLCWVSHEALREYARRVHLDADDDKVFEVYRELIEQVASDAYDAGTKWMMRVASSLLRKRSTEYAAAHRRPSARSRENPNR